MGSTRVIEDERYNVSIAGLEHHQGSTAGVGQGTRGGPHKGRIGRIIFDF